MKMASVVPVSVHKAELNLINVHHFVDGEVYHLFQQLHDLICELETLVIATAKSLTHWGCDKVATISQTF